MSLLQELYTTFKNNKNRRAFCIEGEDISYGDFLEYINGSRELIENAMPGINNPVGIVYSESIETYAAIFAAWFSGNYFIPLNPKHPTFRNLSIIENVRIKFILSAKEDRENIIGTDKTYQFIHTAGIKSNKIVEPKGADDDQLLYILTTSGSTGVPKYVPINIGNVAAYCAGFRDRFPELNSDACFLQVFDLTVDAPTTSYLVPLLVGACVYTLPDGPFKFLTVAKMLADKKITWVKITPSVLSFLDEHKSKLDFKHLKCIIFGCEALPLKLLKEWMPVFPYTKIANHYGPTETTVGVSAYKIDDVQNIRSKNGIVSIGSQFKTVESIVVTEEGNQAKTGENGELCISGKQVMKDYMNGNDSSFIYVKVNNEKKRFYRTGDVVQKDEDGFIFFIGRTDDQVKIEGHRVNLIEIENRAREILPGYKFVMVAHEKMPGIKRLYLFVEGNIVDKQILKNGLVEKLPPKMVPEDIYLVERIPLTDSGKKDKIKLIKDFLG